MDRRFRAVLSLGAGAMLALGMAVGQTGAQPPPGGSTPAGAATPWVQAPPAAVETPKPAVSPGAVPVSTPTLGSTAPPKVASKARPGGVLPPDGSGHPGGPSPTGAAEETKAKMELERRRELELGRGEQAPGEQKTFEQNLQLWDRLTRDERQALRADVGGRIRVELDEAYKRSGLTLNEDQREMFDLRYRQERRRVERDVQEIARRERERRLPAVDEQMKREFGRASAANAAKAAATPAVTATVSPAPKPLPTATPAGTPAAAPAKA